jgi:hypothetical protein
MNRIPIFLLLSFCLPVAVLSAALPAGVSCKTFYDTAAVRFTQPVWFGEYPAAKGTFLVAEMGGNLFLLEPSAGGFASTLFGNVRVAGLRGNDGVLGLAFHPDFKNNRKYYVYYNSMDGQSALEERMADESFRADARTARTLLRTEFKPVVHNGGDMHFGRDGYLYLGVGDQGNPLVYNNRSQDLNLLQGKMLRIDVDARDPGLEYGIPRTNPFADRRDSTRREIYAYGLRQPWRWSFDAADGRLMLADVGDWIQEEIDVIVKGGNYGWSRMEGNTCFNGANELEPLDHCDTAGLISPIAVLPHVPVSTLPTSCVIGGYVFRGDSASPFFGSYIFGDHETGKLWGLAPGGTPQEIGTAPSMSSFGMDGQGNLYVVAFESGAILRLDHPGLAGKGLAIRPRGVDAKAAALRRVGDKWWFDARAFPGLERLTVFGMDGRVVLALTGDELGRGAGAALPSGLYAARGISGGRVTAFPLLLP